MQAKLEVGKWQDVIEMRKELGKARENLAEIKAIQLYISQQRPAITSKISFLKVHGRNLKGPVYEEAY